MISEEILNLRLIAPNPALTRLKKKEWLTTLIMTQCTHIFFYE